MAAFAGVLAGMFMAAAPGVNATGVEDAVINDPGLPVDEGSCLPQDDGTGIDSRTGAPCVPVDLGDEASPSAPPEERPEMRPGGEFDDTAPGGQGLPAENRGEIGDAPPPEDIDVPRSPEDFAPPTNTDPAGDPGSILSPGVGATPTPEFTPSPAGDPHR